MNSIYKITGNKVKRVSVLFYFIYFCFERSRTVYTLAFCKYPRKYFQVFAKLQENVFYQSKTFFVYGAMKSKAKYVQPM